MVLHTFAAHYCAIQGAIKVPSLGDANLLDNQAYGALAMSAAAVCIFLSLTIILNGPDCHLRLNVLSPSLQEVISQSRQSGRARQRTRN